MRSKSLAVSALAAALKRGGSRGPKAQRLLRLQAERGDPQVAVEALAQALLFEGVRDRLIPRPSGTRTKELADRAEEAIIKAAAEYHESGGVLLAKGYVERLHLIAEMAKQWLDSFTTTLSENLDPEPEEELVHRLALVAQLVGVHLLDGGGVLDAHGLDTSVKNRPAALALMEQLADDPFQISLEVQDLEGLCMRLARVMFEAYQMSEDAAHAALHGEEVDRGDDTD